jgi:hypothetical protein
MESAKYAVYTILIERELGEDDYFEAHGGDGAAAAEQVAAEIQEAMQASGLPVGFFRVVKREIAPIGSIYDVAASYASDSGF